MPKDILTVDGQGNLTVVTEYAEGDEQPVADKPEPFAGKGDHDDNGKVGGAHPPIDTVPDVVTTKAPVVQHRRTKRRK
jgi:hypothetical protein